MTKSKCWLLFKTQMRNEFGRSLKSRGRKMTSFAIGIVLLMLVFYAYMLSYGLGSMGMAEVIPSYGLAITGLITLFFTALKTNGVLFAYKEYDMVMSLPVKTSTVIASRFMTHVCPESDADSRYSDSHGDWVCGLGSTGDNLLSGVDTGNPGGSADPHHTCGSFGNAHHTFFIQV